MPEAEETVNAGYVPEITWNDHVVWRGELRAGRGRDAAYVAARCMADRISPAVTVGDRPALRVDLGDPVAEFRLGYSDCDYRSESMTALQRAAQVFAEMSCRGVPAVAWEPVIMAGAQEIWVVRDRLVPCESTSLAQTLAEKTLTDHLRPAARASTSVARWKSRIEYVHESGAVDSRDLGAERWGTRTEAWRHAAEVLASAGATIRKTEKREPLMTMAETFSDTQDVG